jgi:hypothetical protein
MLCLWRLGLYGDAAFQAALPGSRGAAYLQQRGMPLALAQQCGVGYAAPGSWPHAARDWRGGRVVCPHTTPDGCLVNLYGRAVGAEAQVPKAKRHDHLPGAKGYFNAAALHAGAGPLWVCEGAFDALALLAAGVPRVVAIFGVQGWRWDWVREVRELVFALDADANLSAHIVHCSGGQRRVNLPCLPPRGRYAGEDFIRKEKRTCHPQDNSCEPCSNAARRLPLLGPTILCQRALCSPWVSAPSTPGAT